MHQMIFTMAAAHYAVFSPSAWSKYKQLLYGLKAGHRITFSSMFSLIDAAVGFLLLVYDVTPALPAGALALRSNQRETTEKCETPS